MIRLLELRVEKGFTQRDMAKELKISQGTYNNWGNGRTQPSIEQLIVLAGLFSVSVDYLIGNTDDCLSFSTVESLTNDEKRLLKNFRSLNQGAREGLLQFLEKKN